MFSKTDNNIKKKLLIDKLPLKPPGQPRFKTINLINSQNNLNNNNSNILNNNNLNNNNLNNQSNEEINSIQLLIDGYVQSYVDFYHLTQRIDPNNTDGVYRKIQCTNDEMLFIRNNLVLAEISRRQGNIMGVYTAYNKLASSYKKKKDWKTAIFFQEKCLEVAQLTTDLKAEMLANHTLGIIYQSMNNYELARVYHERHEEIAKSIDLSDEIVTSNMELQKVYMILGERLEEQKHYSEALNLYELCLNSSIKCMDLPCQGEVYGKIGTLILYHGRGTSNLGSGLTLEGMGMNYLNNKIDDHKDNNNNNNNNLKMNDYDQDFNNSIGNGNGNNGNSMSVQIVSKQDLTVALYYIQQYNQITSDIGDTISRCNALSLLSLIYDLLGESSKALSELSLVHTIAEQTGDVYLQSKACYSLGTLYSKLGQYEQSRSILQRYFDLLKAITSANLNNANTNNNHNHNSQNNSKNNNGNNLKSNSFNLDNDKSPANDGKQKQNVGMKDLELSRVYVGISRGNVMFEEYMNCISGGKQFSEISNINITDDNEDESEYEIINNNQGSSSASMIKLLDWKLNRTELISGTINTGSNNTVKDK